MKTIIITIEDIDPEDRRITAADMRLDYQALMQNRKSIGAKLEAVFEELDARLEQRLKQ